MADTIDEGTLNNLLEKAKELINLPKEINTAWESVEGFLKKSLGAVDDFSKSINHLNPAPLHALTLGMSALFKQTVAFQNIGPIDINIKSNFSSYKSEMNALSEGLIKDANGAKDIGVLESIFQKAKLMGAKFSETVLPASFNDAKNIVLGGLASMGESIAAQVDSQNNLIASFYETSLSGGQLNQIMMNTDGFQKMEEYAKNLAVQLAYASKETYQSKETLAALQKALQTAIPNSIYERGVSLGEIFTQLSMSGRSSSEVIAELSNSFERYGKTQTESLEIAARYSQLQEKTGTKMSFVKSYLDSVSESFKNFGESSLGASNIFASLFEGFDRNKVSQQQSLEIIKKYTEGIASLSTAQKAFLSQQTGGPGGLMGAFQIEKDLREGKIDKVFERVQQSMRKQFGGQIVTLDQAAISPKAAAQYQKQLAILTQGALGQMVNQDQAKAAIDVMAKGGSGKDIQNVFQKEDAQNYQQNMVRRGSEVLQQTKTGTSEFQANKEASFLLASADVRQTSLQLLQAGKEGREKRQGEARNAGRAVSIMDADKDSNNFKAALASSIQGMTDVITKFPQAIGTVADSMRKAIREASTPITNANQSVLSPAKSSGPQTMNVNGRLSVDLTVRNDSQNGQGATVVAAVQTSIVPTVVVTSGNAAAK